MIGKTRKEEAGVVLAGRDPVLVALGARIREFRVAAGLSQRKLAEVAGLSQAYVYLMEGGGSNMTVGVAAKVAGVLGVSLVALFQGKGEEGVAGPLLEGVEDDLRRLADLLSVSIERQNRVLEDVERRLEAHREISDALLHRKDKGE